MKIVKTINDKDLELRLIAVFLAGYQSGFEQVPIDSPQIQEELNRVKIIINYKPDLKNIK